MKPLQMELPDKIAGALDSLVQAGWFQSQEEAVRAALAEFLRRHRLDLTEKHQRADIAWALRHKGQRE